MQLVAVARLATLLAFLAWIPAPTPGVAAPEVGTEAGAAPEPEAIPFEEIADRAEEVRSELARLRPKEASREQLERIAAEIEATLPEIESRLARTDEALAGEPNARTLTSLDAQVRDALKSVLAWEQQLDDVVEERREALDQIDAMATAWERTAEIAKGWGVSTTTSQRIRGTRREISDARAELLARGREYVTLRDRLVDPGSALRDRLAQLEAAGASRIQGLLEVDRPPLWSSELRDSLRTEWQERGHVLEELQQAANWVRENARMLSIHLGLFIALGAGLLALRSRAREWAEDDYDLAEAREVFERPWAMALIISVVATTDLYELAPRAVAVIASPAIALAAVTIGRRFLVPSMAPLFWGLMAIFVVDQCGDLLSTAAALDRVAAFFQITAALLLLLWLQRPQHLTSIPLELRRSSFMQLLGAAMRVGSALLAVALFADLFGWGNLSNLLGHGVLRAAYLGVFVFVSLKVFQSLMDFALVVRPLRLVRGITRHRNVVRRRLKSLLYLVALGTWVSLTLSELGLWGSARTGVVDLLEAQLTIGALSISAGNVLAFILTVWLSFLISRLVDFVLREDVFTRVETGRGVPYAVSGLARYGLIFAGFLVALAAAGVELGSLTVIAGGLGVGVGFGLQNVVNNFVSGLILLFERPIQVGDTIQLPEVWGEMKRIGIRSSVVRTFDGAEVILPNGMLVSEKVTNWTLSDNRRRVEVDIGVAYGTPAPRVIELLLEVARTHHQVLPTPEPQALFLEFGDSALLFRLRLWIGKFDDGYPVRSDLAVAIQTALEEAGIKVPFPQRDLHLVSVSAGVGSDPSEGR